jgi:predicted ATPase
MGLFGRNDEVSALKSCFEHMMKTKHSKLPSFSAGSHFFHYLSHEQGIGFIRGLSGTGKSSLAASIKQDVETSDNGLHVEGKFDVMTSNEPYSGGTKAFGRICRQVQASTQESTAAVGRMISNELQDEVHTLLPLIPDLRESLTLILPPEDKQRKIMEREELRMGKIDGSIPSGF